MHHSKAEILRDLDPTNPSTIQALIDFHRTTFGGWTMEGEGDTGESGTEGDTSKLDDGKDGGDKPDDKPLGPNGEKALQSELDARKALESQLNQLKAGFAQALGLTDKDAKSGTDEIVSTLQQQMAAMQHDNLVLSVANTHKITDEDDLALLRSIKDEDALRKLAARLKPSEQQGDQQQKRRTPTPDPSQGQGSGQNGGRPSSVAQVMAERAAARAAKSK